MGGHRARREPAVPVSSPGATRNRAAPRLRAALDDLRLRAVAPAHASTVRARYLAPRGARRAARSRPRAGDRRGPAGGPSGRVRRGRPALLARPERSVRGRHRTGRRPGLPGHARGRGRSRGRLRAGDGCDPPRRSRACLPSRRRPSPRDARPRIRLLRLQRPGAGDLDRPTSRPARAVRGPRHAPRRRRAGDPCRGPGRPHVLDPRIWALPVPGQRVRRRDRLGSSGGHGRQRPARAVHRRIGLAGRGRAARAGAGRRVRPGRGGQPARRRFPRLGPARAPARHDDRDGLGGAAGRRGRPPVRGRTLAGNRRWRLRRLPGRAPRLGRDLARRRAPRCARVGAGDLARPLGGGGGALGPGAIAGAVHRSAERRASGQLGTGRGRGRVAEPRRRDRLGGGPGAAA